jgi:glycosyltransferase involved in cell wall biosynthesis
MLVGNFLSKTGIRSVCEDLAEHLSASGHSVFTTSRRKSRSFRFVDMTSTVWRQRHKYSVALVDVYSGLAFLWAESVCWLLRRSRKPYILTMHGGKLPDFARRSPKRVHRLLNSAAFVSTPSRYLLEQMSPYRCDLQLVPNPLNLGFYKFRLRTQPQAKLIWLRAFHEVYNPSQAPKVLASLIADFPEIHLAMIGPDKGDGSLQRTQEEAGRLGVLNQISFVGSIPKSHVSEWINSGDIFLNTTSVDNTPVTILEAMACGLPVISTNAGGIPYLLENDYNALLVPRDDPDAMAAAVRRVLTEPGLAAYLARNARQKVEHFDWSIILPEWETLLARCV